MEVDYYIGYTKESISFGGKVVKPIRVWGYPWELEHPQHDIIIKLSEDLEKQNWKLLGVTFHRDHVDEKYIILIVYNDNPIMKTIVGYDHTCSFIVQNMSKEDAEIKEMERVRVMEILDYEMDCLQSDNEFLK